MSGEWRQRWHGAIAALLLALAAGCSSPQEQAAEAALAASQAFEAGDYVEARARMLDAVAARDDVPDYWMALARIELELQRYRAAYDAFTRALELDRTNVEALQALGDLAVLFRRPDEAIGYSDRLLEINPNDVRAKLAKATIMLQQKRNREAMAIADQILAADPQIFPALIVRAKAMTALGQPRPAAEQLELAMRIQGSNPVMLETLIEIYRALGDRAALQRSYARLIEARPEDIDLRLEYARQLYRDGRSAEAQALLERLQQEKGSDPALAEQIVNVWLQPEVLPLPAGDMRRLGETGPPAMRAALARYAIESGRAEEALPLLAPLLGPQVTPGNAYASALQADAQHRLGRTDQALALVQNVLAVDSSSPRALMVRAEISIERGQFRQALRDAQILVRDNPRLPEARLLLARAHAGRGEHNVADITFRRAVSDFPRDSRVAESYLAYLVGRRDVAGALAVAEEFAERNPGSVAGRRMRETLCRRVGGSACGSRAMAAAAPKSA
jgi:tetratricopeptide (TPR) repeat protein